MIHVCLGGEGPNELGRDGKHPGVVETMLRRICANGWVVVGRTPWRRITKLKANGPTPNEEQNVLGLALEAKRAGANVLAFIRDGDGFEHRKAEIAAAIQKIPDKYPEVLAIGGTAVPVLEGWLLAMKCVHGTEELSKKAAQSKLEQCRVPPKSTAEMVQIVKDADFSRLPKDAVTLNDWIDTANRVLPPLIQP